jgi:hypothetical protein
MKHRLLSTAPLTLLLTAISIQPNLGCVAGAVADAPDPAIDNHASEIAGGTLDGPYGHPFVGQMSLYDANGNGMNACSAFLISPRWVMTANHCITGTTTFKENAANFWDDRLQLTIGVNFDPHGIASGNPATGFWHTYAQSGPIYVMIPGTKGMPARQVCESCASDSAMDVALFQLDTPVTNIQPVRPVARVGACAPKFDGLLIGYGANGGWCTANADNGDRNSLWSTGWDRDSQPGNSSVFQNNWSYVCGYGGPVHGDSGGPLLHDGAVPCGVASRYYASVGWLGPSIKTDYAALDSQAAIDFVRGIVRPIAFQASTGNLWVVGTDGEGDTRLGMMRGTSPSLAWNPAGGSIVAFQANTGHLWTSGALGAGDTQLGMKAGTSPSVVVNTNGGVTIAFQANTGNLWITGTGGNGDTHLGMMAGTSPSIVAQPNGGYTVAFQANTGHLWLVGAGGIGDAQMGMMAGTSPSLVAQPNGGYTVAFQANTGNLWTYGVGASGNTGLAMMRGTSPSITAPVGGGFTAAFQGSNGHLWVYGASGTRDLAFGLMAGTSPSIAAGARSGYTVAFEANTGNLWTYGVGGSGDLGVRMMYGTNPGI